MKYIIEKRIKEVEGNPRIEDIFYDLVDGYAKHGGYPLDLSEGSDDKLLFENMAFIIWENGLLKEIMDNVYNKSWLSYRYKTNINRISD